MKLILIAVKWIFTIVSIFVVALASISTIVVHFSEYLTVMTWVVNIITVLTAGYWVTVCWGKFSKEFAENSKGVKN